MSGDLDQLLRVAPFALDPVLDGSWNDGLNRRLLVMPTPPLGQPSLDKITGQGQRP